MMELGHQLRAHLAAPTVKAFAVVDGALFEDCAERLQRAGLAHRSLYRRTAPPDLTAVGPYLVDLAHRPVSADSAAIEPPPETGDPNELADRMAAEALAAYEAGDETGGGAFTDPFAPVPADPNATIAALLGVIGDAPHGAVFWIGGPELTEPALWRHVRTLNRILVPSRFVPKEEPTDEPVSVVFRHADGNVLAEILPVLTERQFARILGPADAIMFSSPTYPTRSGATVREAHYPDGVPRQGAAMLALSVDQMEAIEEKRLQRFVRDLAEYLREVLPEHSRDMNDEELRRYARERVRELCAYGVFEEPPHYRWAFLQLYSGGGFGRSDYVRSVMTDPRPSPTRSERVMMLFQRIHEKIDREAAEELTPGLTPELAR